MVDVYEMLIEHMCDMCEMDEDDIRKVVKYLRGEALVDYFTLRERFLPQGG